MSIVERLRKRNQKGDENNDNEVKKMYYETYCMHCKDKREVKDATIKKTKTGRIMVGTCVKCGAKVARTMPKE